MEQILTTLQSIWTALGVIAVAGGGLVAIAYGIFKFLGEKWLNAKFEERLAAYKHEQQKELEELRFKINALMDRTVKLHQREFDTLPEAWGRLNDAFSIIHAVSLSLQMTPNLDVMSAAQLEEFLEKSPIDNWQKTELRAEERDKSRYYANAITPHELTNATKLYLEYHNYFAKNGIFIPEPMKSKFAQFDAVLRGALIERQSSRHSEFDNMTTLHSKGGDMLRSLEQDVQARLWNSSTNA